MKWGGKMSKRRIHLIHTECKRCGRPLMTASRSIHGADQLKARLGDICDACITKEEEREIEQGIAGAILGYNVVTPKETVE